MCQDRKGYHNLNFLSSLAYTEGKFYGLPRVDHELLEKYNEGLIALSAGLDGDLAQHLRNGCVDEARSLASWYRDVFAGRYYFELQVTGNIEQNELNSQLMELSGELDIPLVAYERLPLPQRKGCIRPLYSGIDGDCKNVSRILDIPSMKSNQLYLKSQEEMQTAFSSYPQEVLTNSVLIAEQCNLSLENNSYYLPKFEIPTDETLDSHLIRQARQGLQNRLENLYILYNPADSFETFRSPYDERLSFELNVIIQMEFPGYFLIVADFVNWAKDHEILVGPGRGSGAASLVAYALRITDVDPLRYGLLFERFLNPDRISLPDFDIDFEVNGREAVINYVRKKYGENNVCQIATFQSFGTKGSHSECGKSP